MQFTKEQLGRMVGQVTEEAARVIAGGFLDQYAVLVLEYRLGKLPPDMSWMADVRDRVYVSMYRFRLTDLSFSFVDKEYLGEGEAGRARIPVTLLPI